MTHSKVYRSYLDSFLPIVKKAIQPQTGFLHFHKKSYEGEPSYTIPVYENVLAALFLLRTKEHEQVQEAKRLLQALFPFRLPQGTFPTFLHDYPKPMGDVPSLFLLAAFWMIREDFGSILGHPLLEQLEEISSVLLKDLQTKETLKPYTPLRTVLEFLHGERWGDVSFSSWWKDLRFSTLLLLFLERGGETCLPFVSGLFSNLSSLWNPAWSKSTSYGSSLFFNGQEAVVSLFDYYMSSSFGEKRSSIPLLPYLLDIAWMNPSFLQPKVSEGRGVFCDSMARAISLPQVEVRALLTQPPSHELFGFHPLVLFSRRFSPVFHFPKASVHSVEERERMAIFCLRGAEDERSLFQFFIEGRPGEIDIVSAPGGQKASYWCQEKEVFLSFDGIQMRLFVETDSPLCFHLLKADRPSQLLPSRVGTDWLLEAKATKGCRGESWKIGIEVLS